MINPTYHKLGDHTETVQLDFNPAVLSYENLLSIFWREHNPEFAPFSRQYMSLILYHSNSQRLAAMTARERERKSRDLPVMTEIAPLDKFYLAEDYHQKYYLRGVPGLLKELKRYYPQEIDFINSTAAARLNGFAAGYGMVVPELDLDKYGLSAAGKDVLLKILRRAKHANVC